MSAALAERAGAGLDQGARKALYKGDLLFALFQGRVEFWNALEQENQIIFLAFFPPLPPVI